MMNAPIEYQDTSSLQHHERSLKNIKDDFLCIVFMLRWEINIFLKSPETYLGYKWRALHRLFVEGYVDRVINGLQRHERHCKPARYIRKL